MIGGWPGWLNYAPLIVLLGMFVWFVTSWDPYAPKKPQTRAQHIREVLFWILMTANWTVLLAYKWRDPDASRAWIVLYSVAAGAGAIEALRWLLKVRRIPAEGEAERSSSPPRT